ncbi:MAG: VPLPA-CTERM-specific exosortase XrtD [Alteromonadaceae bacterium]|nr:MAG: VPLPA-CTERM-specific exosortase XrtD [Alteromonadaceae bacterium]
MQNIKELLTPRNILLLIVSVLSTTLYWSGLVNVFTRWGQQEEYSHGYLIPVVSLYILWEKRLELQAWVGRGSWLGLPLCLAAIALLFVGEISALFIVIHYSFLTFLLGLSIIVLGRGSKITFIPIVILGFAIPLPYFLEVVLTAKMQLLSSSIGVEIMRLFNIPVYLSGNVIDMGEFKLHVVEACSGLRYLFPLTCLGFIAAYFYQAALWKRAIIFFSTIPITIGMNSLRIAVTGLFVENYGIGAAEGFLHDFEGWVIFVICMAILIGEILLLERLTSRNSLAQIFTLVKVEPPANNKPTQIKKRETLFFSSLITLLLLAAVAVKFVDTRKEVTIETTSLASFSMKIGTWQGERELLAQEVISKLEMSDYLLANYTQLANPTAPINFYVAYYANQRKGASPHSPKVCMPGGGWEIAELKRTQLNGIPVNRAVIRKGQSSQLVYYWFVERGEPVANEFVKKWMLFRDAIYKNRTDGALVRVVTPIKEDEGVEAADARVAAFVSVANPQLANYLPSTN